MARKKKNTQQEKTIFESLIDMGIGEPKAHYLLYKYAPQLLKQSILGFDELRSTYKCLQDDMYNEEYCNNWLVEDSIQPAIKFIKQKLHPFKLLELYDIYCDKAKDGDVQAFKAWVDFSKEFFTDSKQDDLLAILHGTDISDNK